MIFNRIAVFRAERGLSRKDLAEKVDVNPQTIGFLERGKYSPSVELALKLAREFNVGVENLFSLTAFPALASELRSRQVTAPANNPNVQPTGDLT
jgi:DNA-binding XRE family transcriptional regulator